MNKQLSFGQSVALFIGIIVLLFVSMFVMKSEPHIPLLAGTAIVATCLHLFGFSWKELEEAILKGIRSAIMPIIILGLIGILIAVWMMSGTVPTILYVGLEYINPQHFAISALFITIIVSMFTGSSFTTVSTVGVALMGMAIAMGVNPVLAAGAVISGACLGDKMSPLSDTTSFAPAVAGVQLFTHIQNMLYTTIPALFLTIIFFIFVPQTGGATSSSIMEMQQALQASFHIHILTILSPAVVLYCSIRRKPIIPTLAVGIVSGLLVALFVQGETSVSTWFQVMQNGYKGEVSSDLVASIVHRGGLQSMLSSISLILIALALGGLLQHCGVIRAVFERFVQPLRNPSHIVLASGSSAIAVNALTGEQYLSILLPGQMFKEEFSRRQIPLRTLSRTLEDCGTLINPLIPWGVSGAFFAVTLGVPVVEYIPYAIFLWVSPLITFSYAYLPKLKRISLGDALQSKSSS
ncbi:Na+/H+ antiporter NhaC [Paenibacillus sp. N1-5-1-14]|uniref:Na+/H+ antiporter NhaC n=1 Tax=Paenibacillus radicibacter TaxID=2972488 RepID=UPI002158E5B5|nr:Na+/H+ antiporter NhaC [Paenibacillus radicibacter]MCR8644696.1 Na+/H+ antiporter NhaC [Paenibacillus radicibacter]